MITIERKKNVMMEHKIYSNTQIVDVSYSSRFLYESGKLNPFYPHKKIPIPFTHGYDGISVSSIWNSLKVFEDSDVNMALRNSTNIQDLKRENLGRTIGFRQGYFNNNIMTVAEARRKIFIPMYRWTLEQKAFPIIQILREIVQQRDIVLLDDSVNCDINNINQPLSHAWLTKSYIEGSYPFENIYEHIIEYHIGPKDRRWTTTKKVLKEIKPDNISSQFDIEFDYDC